MIHIVSVILSPFFAAWRAFVAFLIYTWYFVPAEFMAIPYYVFFGGLYLWGVLYFCGKFHENMPTQNEILKNSIVNALTAGIVLFIAFFGTLVFI